MIEKKKLMDTAHDLDPDDLNDPYPEDHLEKEMLAKNSIEERNASRHFQSLFLLLGLLGTAFILSSLIILHFRRSDGVDDFVKFKTSFRGNSGRLIEQETVSSGINNIIEYHVTVSPDEQLTIIDDFNKDIQVVKISTNSGEFCYVSELKKGFYVRPSDLVFGSQADKSYVSQVYETVEKQADETQLGEKGAELCRGTPVEWIRPVSDIDSYITAANFTESSYVPHSRSRKKRNIRNCHVSCCYSVCCCTVHHFTWERVEHFTCNHICSGCTAKFKKEIRKIC